MKATLLRNVLGLTLAAGLSWLLPGCATREAKPGPTPAVNAPVPPAPPAPPAPPVVPQPPTPADAAPHEALPELEGEGWETLFDGQTLKGWKITDFGGHGEVTVENGQIILGMGAMLTGISGTNTMPKWNYEIALDAMKKDGSDFFCGLTFPVGENCCSFIIGGWGGGTVGISSIDGGDASMNETSKFLNFPSGKWYRVRVRVTPAKLEAWIGREKMVDLKLEGRRIGMRPGEIEIQQPFGISTFTTTGALRNIQYRRLAP
jgi:hypothetical protein